MANAAGQSIELNIQGPHSAYGETISVTQNVNMAGANVGVGELVSLAGRSTGASSAGYLIGNMVATQSSTQNNSSYIGYYMAFSTENGGLDLQGTGDVSGFMGSLVKTSTGGNLKGMLLDVRNTTAAANSVRGIDMTIDVSGGSTDTAGINIYDHAGTLQDGIRMTGQDGMIITDGVDVSDSKIVNAINLGQNTILANGSFSIDLLNTGSNTTLTIQNSNGSYTAGLSVEGDLVSESTGYLQFKKNGVGAPTAGDCDNNAEYGRFYLDTSGNKLYVCNGASRGWDSISLDS